MARKDIYKDAKPFKKGDKRINRTGANRKTVSKVIKELSEKGVEQVTVKQITELYETLLNLTQKELTDFANDKEQPMLNRIVAKEMLNKKGFEIIEKMLDRVHGKATQKVQTDSKVEINQNLENISTEELIKRAEAISKLSNE